ncbi:MAG TPA: NifU family protein [Solirubrobacteraceae bacterium]|nr:NifU family protein [Solirubrobacteraceae bacterium]
MAIESPEALMERVQALTAQLDEVQDFQARAVAEELVASIVQLYGAGLERIFDALGQDEASAAQVRDLLVEDGVVASLMLIHGLYPVDLETRVHEALDSVRPYMESHGGDVELVGIEEGVARLRLVGHCRGCPASEATLELAIKTALEEAAPDLDGLEVEGVTELAPATGGFELPVAHAGGTPNGNGNGTGAPPAWTELEGDAPAAGCTVPMTAAGADLLLANVGGTLLAYRNACGSCGARLDGAPMTPGGTLTCPSCERRFELRHAGRSPDDEQRQIAPVPLLRGGGAVRVAIA